MIKKKMTVITNKVKFNRRYGFEDDAPHGKRELARITGVPFKYINKVFNRGEGARRSNPESVRRVSDGKKVAGSSLKGKYSGTAWGFARSYSFLTKQKGTWGGADKDIADEVKKLKIKGFMR
jgi:hypothetical protein